MIEQIIRIIINLFVNALIPTSFTSISRDLDLPPIPLQSPVQVIERNDKANDVGLFGAFANYVNNMMNDEPPEPNDQEIEATLCTVDCISACRFEEILGNVSELPVNSLKSLTQALLSHLPEQESPPVISTKPDIPAPTPVRVNGPKPLAERPVYSPAVVYVLELATILALRDEQTITILGAEVADALQSVIREADKLHPIALSRTVFYLLALLRASNDHKYIRTPVVLHAISRFRQDLLRQCAQPILKGIHGCISGPAELKNEMATSPDFWAVMHALQPQPEAAALVFHTTELIANGPNSAITADNYEATVALLNAFATAGSVGAKREQIARRSQQPPQDKTAKKSEAVIRGTRALRIVSQLASRVPTLIEQSHLETNEAWRAYWSPVLQCLATQCVNPCREIRQQAFTSLQRCLQSPELASPDHKEWTNIFGEVLFPLINQLLKPEVYQTDPVGMSETRVQAAQLLCKIFLHYLVLLSEWDGVLDLWVTILSIMDRLMNSGQSDTLVEAVPESLKNILLVMSNGGYMVPPSSSSSDGHPEAEAQTPQQKQIWTETWTRLDRFLPGLMPELFPEETSKKPSQPPGQHPAAAAPPADEQMGPSHTAPPTQLPSRPASAVAEPQAA